MMQPLKLSKRARHEDFSDDQSLHISMSSRPRQQSMNRKATMSTANDNALFQHTKVVLLNPMNRVNPSCQRNRQSVLMKQSQQNCQTRNQNTSLQSKVIAEAKLSVPSTSSASFVLMTQSLAPDLKGWGGALIISNAITSHLGP